RRASPNLSMRNGAKSEHRDLQPDAMGVATRLAAGRLREAGIVLKPLLRSAGLSAIQIDNEDVRIDVASQIRFLELAAKALNEPWLDNFRQESKATSSRRRGSASKRDAAPLLRAGAGIPPLQRGSAADHYRKCHHSAPAPWQGAARRGRADAWREQPDVGAEAGCGRPELR